MTTFDPRELSDRDLFRYLLFGDLARPGWPGRRRQLVRRLLVIALITIGVIVGLVAGGIGLVLAWAVLG